jgi:ATP-dependent Zn protease
MEKDNAVTKSSLGGNSSSHTAERRAPLFGLSETSKEKGISIVDENGESKLAEINKDTGILLLFIYLLFIFIQFFLIFFFFFFQLLPSLGS